jgi:hypothetical protein
MWIKQNRLQKILKGDDKKRRKRKNIFKERKNKVLDGLAKTGGISCQCQTVECRMYGRWKVTSLNSEKGRYSGKRSLMKEIHEYFSKVEILTGKFLEVKSLFQ